MSLAIAGAGLAWSPDGSLVEINPAHVWGVGSEELGYGYLRMFGGLAGHTLTWQGHWRGAPSQLRMRTLIEKEIELRGDIPTAEPLGLFSARLMTVQLTRGWQLGLTQVGISVGAGYQRMYQYDGRGFWFSAGWQGALGSRIRWGLALSNVGLGESLVSDQLAVLPWRGGGGIALSLGRKLGTLAADMVIDSRRGSLRSIAWQSGGEGWQALLGIQQSSSGLRFGAGFQFSKGAWQIGYASSYQASGLGQPQMVQLSRRL